MLLFCKQHIQSNSLATTWYYLVRVMAWCKIGGKPLNQYHPSLLTLICVTQPQWVQEAVTSYVQLYMVDLIHFMAVASNSWRTLDIMTTAINHTASLQYITMTRIHGHLFCDHEGLLILFWVYSLRRCGTKCDPYIHCSMNFNRMTHRSLVMKSIMNRGFSCKYGLLFNPEI